MCPISKARQRPSGVVCADRISVSPDGEDVGYFYAKNPGIACSSGLEFGMVKSRVTSYRKTEAGLRAAHDRYSRRLFLPIQKDE